MQWMQPVIDDFASTPFIPKEPIDLISEGNFAKVPFIYGANADEGDLFTSPMILSPKERRLLSKNWEVGMPLLVLRRDVDEHNDDFRKIARKVARVLFANKVSPDFENEDDVENLSNLVGDGFAGYLGTRLVRTMAGKSSEPVYEYRYNHIGSFSATDFFGGVSSIVKMAIRVRELSIAHKSVNLIATFPADLVTVPWSEPFCPQHEGEPRRWFLHALQGARLCPGDRLYGRRQSREQRSTDHVDRLCQDWKSDSGEQKVEESRK